MNDLELLRRLGDETRPSGPGEIGAARARLLAQLTQDPAARRRRRLVFGGVSVAAAAAVAVGVLITASGAASPGMTISAHLTAKQILDRAAATALSEPAMTPRPDQFIYTKEITEYSSGNIRMLATEYWHSVDGLRNSRLTATVTYADRAPTHLSNVYPGCRNGHYNPGGTVPSNPVAGPAVDPGQTVPSYPAKTGACTVWPAYFPDMPTTAGTMLTYLEQTQGVKPGDPASLFHAVAEGVSEDYLLPAQRAALYQLLAATPGLTVVPSVRDAAGRTGVGIQISVYHMVLIFDPRTFAFVGYQGDSTSGGQPPYNDAVLQVAIVDQAGPLP